MPSYDDDSEESAVLGDTLTSTPAVLYADSAEIDDALDSSTSTFVAEDACLNDALIDVVAYLIVESAIIGDTVSAGASLTNTFSDSGRLNDALTLGLLANLVDSIESAQLNDALTSAVSTKITESAVVGDAMTYAFAFGGSLVESGTLNDALTSHLSDLITDSAVLGDAVANVLLAVDLIVESAILNDAEVSSTDAVNLIVEVAVLNDAVSQIADAVNDVSDSGLLDDHLTGGGAGGAWRIPTETFAMSRYTNQPWNSLAVIDGRLVGGSDDGAYFLDSDTDDDGVEIAAAVQYDWLNASIGRDGKPKPSPQLKRPRYLYLEYKGAALAISLKHVQDGSEATASYACDSRTANAFINTRAELGRGIRSVYLKPRLENIGGGDSAVNAGRLAVDELERSIA